MGAFMSDFELLQKKQNQILILVCINFCFFMILFAGLGYIAWQSATLVSRVKGDLDRAEKEIAQLQTRFQEMDTDLIVDRLVTSASKQIGESVEKVVQDSSITAPIVEASAKLTATHDAIEQTGHAIQEINETFKGLDNEEIAKLVSYHILNSLGEGFQKAAEAQKPDPINNE